MFGAYRVVARTGLRLAPSHAKRQMSSGPAAAYDRLLTRHPLLVKSVTSAVIVAIGDVFAQKAIEKRKKLQWRRLANMGILGLALVGPGLHFWCGAPGSPRRA